MDKRKLFKKLGTALSIALTGSLLIGLTPVNIKAAEPSEESQAKNSLSIRVDGDSFAAGGYGEEKTFSVLTAEALGADLTNKAQGGWMINNAWQAMVNSGDRFLTSPSPYDIHLINLGYNDVRKNGNKPNFAEETAHRMKAMLAYMNLGTMRDENDTGITWTGSWTQNRLGPDAQGGYLKYTGNPNASAAFEIEGDTLTLGTFVLAKDAGTLKIEVDGETKFEEVMQAGDSGYTPTAVVLRGLGEGTHEVTVSKSDTTGGFIYIDYIGTEAEDAPRILVNSITYMREDRYGAFPGWTNGSKETADATNKAFAEMIAENFGPNVELVDQSSFDPNVLDNILANDLVHPNTEGHKIMTDNILLTYYKILFANQNETLKVGESRQLELRTLDENAKVTWESDNPAVATVDVNGAVTALEEGKANIKASIDENIYAVCEVEVVKDALSIRVDGDSFAAGGYGEEKTFSVLTAEALDANLTNKAQGGWMINNAWQAMINSGDRFLTSPSPYDVHLINLGYNDVRKNGNQPNFAEETAHRMKAMITYMNLGTMRDENDAGITWTGTWNPFNLGADAQGRYLKYTGNPNASASFEIEGDTFTLGTFVLAKNGGTLKIDVDGETKFEEVMQGGDSGYTPTAVVLRGLGEGTHKVTVSKSDTTGGLIYIDYIGTEAEDAPRILVNSITYMREDQYGAFPGWTNGSKETADATNKAFAEMIEESFGPNVELVDQSSFDPNVLDNILANDLVHPNTEGHKIMADNIILTYYKILFANPNETLKVGESRQLDLRTLDENAKVTWESDNPAAATVDENGTVTALQEGRANIKASIDENTYAVCEVEVIKNDEAEKPSKATLEYYLNKAKEHKANGDVDDCVESIKKLFEEAITEGDKVMADEEATYDEIKKAADKLMKAIQALDMKAADKRDLEMAVDLADGIDLSKYVEAGQAEFQKALEDAQAVLKNGDAMQEETNAAWNALVDAMGNLRLKADKSTLEDLLNSIKDLDLSQYTEESVAVFETARANAQAVMENDKLSEDDQTIVDEAVQALKDAKDQLKLKDNSGGDGNGDGNTGDGQTPGNGDNSGNNGNSGSSNGNSNAGISNGKADAPKTGDTAMPFALLAAALIAGGTAVITVRKKSRG